MSRIVTLLAAIGWALVASAAAERVPLGAGSLSVAFDVEYLALLNVSGRFAEVSGELHLDHSAPHRSALRVVARTASISTGSSLRDAALRSESFFDAARHPELLFVSTSIEVVTPHSGIVVGDLTVRGVTRPLELAFILHSADDAEPTGGWKRPLVLRARGVMRRSEWGMASMLPAVADDVKLAIEVKIGQDHKRAPPKEARAP